jgi:hypothetical protein
MPLFFRPFALFIYRYFFRLGMLDGTEGLIFWVLQTFWFRFLVDAKLWEKGRAMSQVRPSSTELTRVPGTSMGSPSEQK